MVESRTKKYPIGKPQLTQARRGHSMIVYKGYIFLFGGIQDITK